MIEIYDHEIDEVSKVLATLQQRAKEGSRNYGDFEREIRDRFAEIGFVVSVTWHSYAIGKIVQTGSAMPEVTITSRTDPSFQWDPDRQVHEVTANILEIPGQEGVIKTDDGGVFKEFLKGEGHGHGHGHSHSH